METRLSREYLLGLITSSSFSYNGTTTTCTLIVHGVPVVGVSRCGFKEQYSRAVGERISYENAMAQLRRYEQYAQHRECAKV